MLLFNIVLITISSKSVLTQKYADLSKYIPADRPLPDSSVDDAPSSSLVSNLFSTGSASDTPSLESKSIGDLFATDDSLYSVSVARPYKPAPYRNPQYALPPVNPYVRPPPGYNNNPRPPPGYNHNPGYAYHPPAFPPIYPMGNAPYVGGDKSFYMPTNAFSAYALNRTFPLSFGVPIPIGNITQNISLVLLNATLPISKLGPTPYLPLLPETAYQLLPGPLPDPGSYGIVRRGPPAPVYPGYQVEAAAIAEREERERRKLLYAARYPPPYGAAYYGT